MDNSSHLELQDEVVPEDKEKNEEISLENLDMLRVIGTGTFARVCLCQVDITHPKTVSKSWPFVQNWFLEKFRH